MDKNLVQIESVEQLAAAYPGLVTDIRTAAVKGVDQTALRAEGAKTERDRILGMAKIQFGEEASAKFSKVIETGVTVEQFQAIKATGGGDGAGGGTPEEEAKRKEMLAAIQGAGAVNPGSGGHAHLATDRPFLTIVDEYVAVHKVGKVVALQASAKAYPEAYKKWIAEAQKK